MLEENATQIDELNELDRMELDLIALAKIFEADSPLEEVSAEAIQKTDTLSLIQEKKEILEQVKNAKELLSLSEVLNSQLTEEQIKNAYDSKRHTPGLYPLLPDQQEANRKLEASCEILLAVVKDPARFEPAGFLADLYTRVTGKEKYVFGEPSKMLKDSASVAATLAYQKVSDAVRTKGPVALEKGGKVASVLGAKIASAASIGVHAAINAGGGALQVAKIGCAATGRAASAVASATVSEYESCAGKKYSPGDLTITTAKAAATVAGSAAKGAAQVASSLYTIFGSGIRAAVSGNTPHTKALVAPDTGSDSDVDIVDEKPSLR